MQRSLDFRAALIPSAPLASLRSHRCGAEQSLQDLENFQSKLKVLISCAEREGRLATEPAGSPRDSHQPLLGTAGHLLCAVSVHGTVP